MRLLRFFRSIGQRVRAFFNPVPAPAPHIEPIDPTEKLLNGRRAQALLSDPLLSAVFESVGNAYRHSWENSTRAEIGKQQIAHLSLAALKDVQSEIRRHIGNAKIFEKDLAVQKAMREGGKQPF